MEVRVNTKNKILRSFLGWLPLALVSAAFYGAIFSLIVMSLLISYVGVAEEIARQIGWVSGLVFLMLGSYIYLKWLTNSLSSYVLYIKNENIFIRGKSGRKSIDMRVPISSIKGMFIGQSDNIFERISSGHGVVRDQVASRVTFFPVTGASFKLDFATKAFDNQSLYDFFVLMKSKGVETNVNA